MAQKGQSGSESRVGVDSWTRGGRSSIGRVDVLVRDECGERSVRGCGGSGITHCSARRTNLEL